MADYTNSHSGIGSIANDNAIETSWNRLEPLIVPEQVRSRHLFGIPLISAMKDPMTGKSQIYTDEMIKDTIERAVSMAEEDTHLDIFPVKRREKLPFDRHDYESFGYCRLEHRPISSVDKLSITPANGVDIYIVPVEWIETAYLPKGQINIIPLVSAIGYSSPAAVSSGGAVFLSVLAAQTWIAAFWQIEYTTGYPDGLLPRYVNELIGVIAAMEVLSALAATYGKSTSHSLGIDSVSQSISTPGPQIFAQRMTELADKRNGITKRLKTKFGLNLFSGAV